LKIQSFAASSGWLERFKKRHNITFKTVSGEAGSVSPEDVGQFQEKLPSLLRDYNPRDIFNADETGLFFRALPNKTYSLKGEKCSGGKLAKERLSILHCVNTAGEREKLLVIGRAARPRAFQRINLNTLPVSWYSNRKSWMTADIMSDYLVKWDKKMGREKRKILLFVDNATSHPKDLKLKNIKIVFLPPNITSICQPLDQGIIKNFKTWYRALILKHILARMDEATCAEDLVKKINLLDVIYFIQKAWNKVTSATITNCFKKAGFRFNTHHSPEESNDNEFEEEDDIPLAVIAEINRSMGQISHVEFNEFVNFDNNLYVNDENMEIDVSIESVEVAAEDEEEEVTTEERIKTNREAIETVQKLKSFCANKDDIKGFQACCDLLHFESVSLKQFNLKQKTLEDYFTQN
jgi:hypothetical protein